MATNMFDGLKRPMDLTGSNLFYGVPDFGNLKQFNKYEKGYQFIRIVSIPKFLEKLATQNDDYRLLIENYKHIIEYEFKGLDGLDNISSDTFEITDGVSSLNMISKTNWNNTSISMRYQETSGSVITKTHELFLTGIKDPRTTFKTYHGLIEDGIIQDPGYQNEVFTFLYFVTDNTGLNIERAFLIMSAQPTTAELSIYNGEKGSIEVPEVSVEFNCYPVTSTEVNKVAQQVLDYMNSTRAKESGDLAYLHKTSVDFKYSGVEEVRNALVK